LITVRLNYTDWMRRERSELNYTEKSATPWFDGRRQKILSAISPLNEGELPKTWNMFLLEKKQTKFVTYF